MSRHALILCAPGRTLTLPDRTLLDAAGLRFSSTGLGQTHRDYWISKLAGTRAGAAVRRYEAWLDLLRRRPALAPPARHDDFEERPARVSLLGEALLRALARPLDVDLGDFVAAPYIASLGNAVSVLTGTALGASTDDRRALAAVLELPAEADVLADQMELSAQELAETFGQRHHGGRSWRFLLAALARRTWRVPDRIARILAAASVSHFPVVRLTAEDPLPALYLLCDAVQWWQRPVRVGSERLVELPEIEVEGLSEGGPDGRYVLADRLVFRLDYRFNDTVLEKTRFDPKRVRRWRHEQLDRLRIACDAFPDVVVEMRFSDGDERFEIVREAEAKQARASVLFEGPVVPSLHANTSGVAFFSAAPEAPAGPRRTTWEEIAPGLAPPGDPEALGRLATVFGQLEEQQAAEARRALGKLLGTGKRAPGVREEAVTILVDHFYDDMTDDGRLSAFEALIWYAQRKGLKGPERERAMEGLMEMYGGLPVSVGAKLLDYLVAAEKAGQVSEALQERMKGLAERHGRRTKARATARPKGR